MLMVDGMKGCRGIGGEESQLIALEIECEMIWLFAIVFGFAFALVYHQIEVFEVSAIWLLINLEYL